MPLSDEQNERLVLILDGLQAVRAQLYERARTFVDDQIERHAKYSAAMFLSPKQEKWLRDLYREFVGTEPEEISTNRMEDDRDPRGDDDMEVPF